MSHIRKRFNAPANKKLVQFTSSLPFDRRLYKHDIAGSIAHTKMLAKQGIISLKDANCMIEGLNDISSEIEKGQFIFRDELEDIHMAIEARLFDLLGDLAGKLHTARSRNDQIALDMRLFTKEAISQTLKCLSDLQQSLVVVAEKNKDVIMPGYTHLQPAQPVLIAHHLLAYFEMLQRDAERFSDVQKRTDIMPIGSGALAGVAYDIDREFLSHELGFRKISQNSMDAVSDRDFVIEYIAAASLCMMHLSRLAEEIIIWSSAEFNFIELDDSFVTGSSIMPQKKNPDAAELTRGKTGRVYGNLIAMLTTMKAQPLAYNRDLQEDKEALFDSVDTLLASLEIFAGMITTLKIIKENLDRSTGGDYILATDLADYLVSKGENFRNAHGITAKLINYAAKKGKALNQLNLGEYKRLSPLFNKEILAISKSSSIATKNIVGGTAPQQVDKAIKKAKEIILKSKKGGF
ncbi:MAG: argininosuccinate lyase [Dehalococcoidia bacterium]|nr:MAG: argininosuccinate lyase [Dehalococcoidia bacterium]